MISVKSHSRTVFLLAAGHRPVDVEWRGPMLVYWFSNDAGPDLDRYNEADRLANVLADEAHAIHGAAMQGTPGGAR